MTPPSVRNCVPHTPPVVDVVHTDGLVVAGHQPPAVGHSAGGPVGEANGRGLHGRKPQPFGIQGTVKLTCAVADTCGAENLLNVKGGREIK